MTKKKQVTTIIACCAFYLLSALTSTISPAISSFAAYWPDASITAIQQIATIPNIVAVPIAIIAGAIAGKKVPFKTLALIACICMAVGGLIPAFYHETLMSVLICRGIFGIGYGIVFATMGTVILRLFSGGIQARTLGFAASSLAATNIICPILVGFLADADPMNVWFIYVVPVLSFILIAIFLPEPEKIEVDTTAAANAKKPKVSLAGWVVAILFCLTIIAYKPIFLGISTVITGEGLGNAAIAGTVISLASVGQLIAGLVFPYYYKAAGKYALPIAMCIVAVSLLLLTFGNLPVIYCAAFLGGWGHSGFLMASVYRSIDQVVALEAVPAAGGLVGAFSNVGGFIASPWMALVATVVGTTDPRMAFAAGAILLIVCAIIAAFVMKSAVAKAEAKKAAAEQTA